MKRYSYFALMLAFALTLLFLDFFSKSWAYNCLQHQQIGVFENALGGVDFSLTLAMNPGAAWGAFANFQNIILIVRILVIVGMLVYLFFFPHDRKKDIPLVLILSGAFGNVVDYFVYGSVVDFLRFNLWGYPFPVFNLADTWITIGVLIFFALPYVVKKKHVA